jgi:adenylate kinase family enzyme
VRRISVVGNSGSGKTTLARALAAELGVPHLELDSVFHQPGWQPLDRPVFVRLVDEFTQAPGWVVDGNYSAVRELIWSRADTVVWLDLPRRLVMRQVIWRTLRRVATKAELWNGNREQWRNVLGRPEESIIVWAWTRHRTYRDRYLTAQADPANAHLTFERVRTGRQRAALLRSAREVLPAERVDRGDLGIAEREAE